MYSVLLKNSSLQKRQISEQVESLFGILEKWDEQGRKEAVQVDTMLQEQVIKELIPSIAAVRSISPRLHKMYQKAIEPDPDLQSYGPVMKEKILALHNRFVLLSALTDSLEACYDEVRACVIQKEGAQPAEISCEDGCNTKLDVT